MPVFHTKTIESILEPVAQQVSRLVILHEEAEDGNAMPDLERPVIAVSRAVANLVKVGRETISSSDDAILKQDMPSALVRVEGASRFLEEASGMLKHDPYSGPARKKLIDGSRGILQGTSALLLCFDESEVRKIVRECKRVLDYLAVAEVIETMEDLVQFLKDLSPCLSKVSREVGGREKELTHQVHREILVRCLEQVKTLAPILICSMKIFIHIISQGGKGVEEAAENRNYLSQRMTDEIHEMVRVLQLTTYDEDAWDADDLTLIRRAHNVMGGKLQAAHDWLEDPLALQGGVGEKAVRQIIQQALRVAERCLPADSDNIRKACSNVSAMTDTLCELRQAGKGATPQTTLVDAPTVDVPVAKATVEVKAEKAQSTKAQDNIMSYLLANEKRSSNPKAVIPGQSDSDSSGDEDMKEVEAVPGVGEIEMMDSDDSDEQVPTVTVGTKSVPLDKVNDELIGTMTSAEKEAYIQLYQEHYSHLYD